MSTDHLLWTKEDQRVLFKGPIFDIVAARHSRPDGKSADFYLMTSPDWVNIVPLTTDEEGRSCFVLVRQFRPGAGRVSVEFPGGLVDKGEDQEIAALRELQEETGYRAGKITKIGSTNPNPAMMTNTVSTYLAQDLELVADLALDANEVLDTQLVPVSEIVDGRHPGFQVNGIMMIALSWYLRWERTG